MGACVSKGKKRDTHDAGAGGDTKKHKPASGADSPKHKDSPKAEDGKAKEVQAGQPAAKADAGDAAESSSSSDDDGEDGIEMKEQVVAVDLEVATKGDGKAKAPKTEKPKETPVKGTGRQEEVMKNKDGSIGDDAVRTDSGDFKRSRGEDKVKHLKEKWEKEKSFDESDASGQEDGGGADEGGSGEGNSVQAEQPKKKKKKKKKEEIEREKRRQQEKEELEREKKRQAELERLEKEAREREEREKRERLEKEERERKEREQREREEFERREREEREQAAREKAEREEKARQEQSARAFKNAKSKWEKTDEEPVDNKNAGKKASPRRVGEAKAAAEDHQAAAGRQQDDKRRDAPVVDDRKVSDARSKFDKGREEAKFVADGKGAGGRAGSGWEEKLKEEEKAKKMRELQEASKTDSGVDKKEMEKRKAQLRDMKDPYWAKLAQEQQLLSKEEQEAARIEAELRKLEADLENLSDVDTSDLASSSSDDESD